MSKKNKDWKQEFANEAEEALEHPIVKRTIEEFESNLTHNPHVRPGSALFTYGLTKVCNAVAQVARAQALGIDPQLLLMDSDEANEAMMRVAEAAKRAGKPVEVVNLDNSAAQKKDLN